MTNNEPCADCGVVHTEANDRFIMEMMPATRAAVMAVMAKLKAEGIVDLNDPDKTIHPTAIVAGVYQGVLNLIMNTYDAIKKQGLPCKYDSDWMDAMFRKMMENTVHLVDAETGDSQPISPTSKTIN